MIGDEKTFKTVAEQGWRDPAKFIPTGADILASNARTVQRMRAWEHIAAIQRAARLRMEVKNAIR